MFLNFLAEEVEGWKFHAYLVMESVNRSGAGSRSKILYRKKSGAATRTVTVRPAEYPLKSKSGLLCCDPGKRLVRLNRSIAEVGDA
jgi:hypothetical protein